MLKMEFYRLFSSSSTWMTLLAAMLLAGFSVLLVHVSASAFVYADAAELLAAQINGGMLMVLCAVATILFASAKYRNGFIKNIVGQLPRREWLVLPEIAVLWVLCALCFLAYASGVVIAGAALFGRAFLAVPWAAFGRFLLVQLILHIGFCGLLLLVYLLMGSTTVATVWGLLMAFKVTNVFYALFRRVAHFDLARYMLDLNIFQLGMGDAGPAYARAAIVGLAFLAVETALLCWVMRRTEIK